MKKSSFPEDPCRWAFIEWRWENERLRHIWHARNWPSRYTPSRPPRDRAWKTTQGAQSAMERWLERYLPRHLNPEEERVRFEVVRADLNAPVPKPSAEVIAYFSIRRIEALETTVRMLSGQISDLREALRRV